MWITIAECGSTLGGSCQIGAADGTRILTSGVPNRRAKPWLKPAAPLKAVPRLDRVAVRVRLRGRACLIELREFRAEAEVGCQVVEPGDGPRMAALVVVLGEGEIFFGGLEAIIAATETHAADFFGEEDVCGPDVGFDVRGVVAHAG